MIINGLPSLAEVHFSLLKKTAAASVRNIGADRTPREGGPYRYPRRERPPCRSPWRIKGLSSFKKRTRHCEGRRPVAIPSILLGLPMVDSARFRGLPRRFAPRNDVFFFRLLSGAALAHCTRRNAGDGVPYAQTAKTAPRREPGGFGVT